MATAPGAIPAAPAADRHRLAEIILAESWRAGLRRGSRLPTERELAVTLGVTRTSVRRALAVLEAEGRISREVGRGTFLREEPWPADRDPGSGSSADSPRRTARGMAGTGGTGGTGGTATEAGAAEARTGLLRGHDGGPAPAGQGGFAPADVMTIRRLLEPPAMKLVVAWATAADFDEMARCLAGGEHAADYEEFESWDLALHRGIMAASHSPLLTRLYAVLEEARHSRFWGDLKRRSASRERQLAYQADHAELVAALRARDADRAVEAMRAHLARVAGHLFDETP